jgi:hypothetical protein
MPKEVLRSGAIAETAAPAAPTTPPPATITPKQKALDEMKVRLEAMALEPALVNAALAAEAKKWDVASAAKPTPPPVAPAPAAAKPVAPAKPKAEPKNVTPAPAAAPVESEADKELRRAYEEDHGVPNDAEPQDEPAEGSPTDDGEHEEESQVVVQNHFSSLSDGALTGPIDSSDFKIPQLKVVQGSGPLSKKFNQGTLIFMDLVLFKPPEPDKLGDPINFIPISLHKYFREDVKRPNPMPPNYVSPQPRNAGTPEEVARLGGTTEFTSDAAGNRLKPSWGPAARIMLLIERPEGSEHPGFAVAVEVGEKIRYFAPAVMYVNGGQYRSMAKPIIDATNFILCQGTGPDRKIVLDKRVWKLQVAKEQSGENMVFNPRVEMIQELTPPALRELAQTMRGKSSKVEAES